MNTLDNLDELIGEAEEGIISRKSSKVKDSQQASRAVTKEVESGAQAVETHKKRRTIIDATDGDVLPNIPLTDPNMHAFWASHSEDARPSLASLLYNGAEYVKLEDVPGAYKAFIISQGGDSQIRVREMVLLKIPSLDWLEHLQKYHHKEPARLQRDTIGAALRDKSTFSGVYGNLGMSEVDFDDDTIAYQTNVSTGSIGGGGNQAVPVEMPENFDNLIPAAPSVGKPKKRFRGA